MPERAFRFVDAAYVRISAADFFAPRMIGLLNQTSVYRRAAAMTGKPLDLQPAALTGDDWRRAWAEAHDPQTDAALDAVYLRKRRG